MKIGLTSYFMQFLIIFSLFSLALYTFTQTSIFSPLITGIEITVSQIPFLIGIVSFVPLLLISIIYLVILVLGVFGGRASLNFVYYSSLVLYLPSALSFSDINWLELFGVSGSIESFLPFELVLLVGMALITCRIFLVNLSSIVLKKNEFLIRGEEEVEGISKKMIVYSSGVLSLAVVVAFFAILVLFIGRDTMAEFLLVVPYPMLLVGLGSVFILIIILHYYLKRGLR